MNYYCTKCNEIVPDIMSRHSTGTEANGYLRHAGCGGILSKNVPLNAKKKDPFDFGPLQYLTYDGQTHDTTPDHPDIVSLRKEVHRMQATAMLVAQSPQGHVAHMYQTALQLLMMQYTAQAQNQARFCHPPRPMDVQYGGRYGCADGIQRFEKPDGVNGE